MLTRPGKSEVETKAIKLCYYEAEAERIVRLRPMPYTMRPRPRPEMSQNTVGAYMNAGAPK